MQAEGFTAASTPSRALYGPRNITGGEFIYGAGKEGIAWRIRSGAVRLDRISSIPGSPSGTETRSFAGLALAGDVIGAETLLFGHYSFEAHALGNGTLEPWLAPETALSGESLLQTLAAAERRAADALSLRVGEAFGRVRQLILLLARERSNAAVKLISIPGLRDMAEMTGLTVETVSRAISHLRKSGLLQKNGRHSALVFPGSDAAMPG
jgi:CRP/FNR family nitrogen fixation transcriptional regulator